MRFCYFLTITAGLFSASLPTYGADKYGSAGDPGRELFYAFAFAGLGDVNLASEGDLNRGPKPVNPGAMYAYPRKERVEIDERMLGLCMAWIAQKDFGGRVRFNKFQMLAIPLREAKIKTPAVEPSLLSYLAAEGGRGSDYVTGYELELKAWVLEQADNSIHPLQIFRKSLELNRGNIWNAVLCVHQLLRNSARWWDFTRYKYNSSKESEEKFFNKFVDIRGDLKENGGTAVGDHFGSWYRIWGAMLYRMGFVDDSIFNSRRGVHPTLAACPQPLEAADLTPPSQRRSYYGPRNGTPGDSLSFLMDDWHAVGVFMGDEYAKYLARNDQDLRKAEIDSKAGTAAGWMFTGLWRLGALGQEGFDPSGCEQGRYLK